MDLGEENGKMHVKKSARSRSIHTSKKHLKPLIMATLAMPVVLSAVQASAAVKYWDLNGTSSGFGTSATGAWNTTTANWNTNSTGTGATTTWANSDSAIFNNSGTVTMASGLTAAAITVSAGNVTLAGSSMALGTGSITVGNGAKLSTGTVGSAAWTASSGSTLTLDGGTIENLVSSSTGPSFITNSTNIVLTVNGGTFITSNTAGPTIIQTGTPATLISGSGALTKSGVGVLAIATVGNSWSGGTIIDQGEIRIRTNNNTLPTGTAVTINSAGILNLNNLSQQVDSISGSGQIGFGTGTLTTIGPDATTFTGTWAPVASVTGSGGVTSGNGRVNIATGSNLTLGAGFNSSLSGSVTIAGGTLNVMSGSLGTAALDLYVNSGTLNLSNGAQTIENLSGSGGTITLGAGTTLTSAAINSRTYGGVLTGAGSLVLASVSTAAGLTLRLSGSSTGYTGNIVVNSPNNVIEVGNANALGAGGNLTLNAGELRATSGLSINTGKTIVLGASGGTIEQSGSSSTLTFGGVLSGGTPLTKTGPGTLLLTNSSNSQSQNIVSAGTLNVSNDGALGTVPTSATAGNISLNGSTLQISGSSAFRLSTNRGITIGGTGSTINVTNSSSGGVTYSGAITGTGGLTRTGSGTLLLNSASSFTGGLTIIGGETAFNDDNAAGSNLVTITPSSSNIIFRNGQSLTTMANDIVINTGTKTVDLQGLLLGTAPNQTQGVFKLTGEISGAGPAYRGLNGGLGIVEIDGNNTGWSGGLTLRQGTLALGQQNALGTGTFTAGSATAGTPTLTATTILTGANAVPNAVSLTNNLTIDGTNDLELAGGVDLTTGIRTLVVNNTGNSIISGNISNGGLIKAGTGNLILTGHNAYTGVTTVQSGSLELNSSAPDVAILGDIAITGGSLKLDGSDQINNLSNLSMGLGELDLLNHNEILSTLTLVDDSTIDMGAGSGGRLSFANSAAALWTSGKTLAILNWSGDPLGGGDMQLDFGNDDTALTSDQLSQIVFVNPTGAPAGTYSAQWAPNNPGEVVAAIPEPTTVSMIMGLGGLATMRLRRRSR